MPIIVKSVAAITLLSFLAKPESCVTPAPAKLEKAAKVCQLIFRGKVISADTQKHSEIITRSSISAYVTVYKILPSKIWRGMAKDTIIFEVGECGTKLKPGEEYIILSNAKKQDRRYSNEQTIVANLPQKAAKLDYIFSKKRFQRFKAED